MFVFFFCFCIRGHWLYYNLWFHSYNCNSTLYQKKQCNFFFIFLLLLLSNRPTGLIRSSSCNVHPFVSLSPSHPSLWCPFLFYICCWKFLLVIYVIYFLFNVSDGFKFSHLLTRLRVSFCAQCYRLWLDMFLSHVAFCNNHGIYSSQTWNTCKQV